MLAVAITFFQEPAHFYLCFLIHTTIHSVVCSEKKKKKKKKKAPPLIFDKKNILGLVAKVNGLKID